MEIKEKEYWKNRLKGDIKKYFLTVENFRETLWDYQPSMIWLDEFSEEIPYINGHYSDGFFHGSYTKQSLLTFDLNSLSQLESVFKEGMYIYI
jgi:hypothetical protein